MTTETSMTVEASLSGSAAKLLLHLLRIGPGNRETPELMRGAGIGDRKAFYAAKEKLQELGLWENPSWCGERPQPVRENPTPVFVNPPAVWENPPTVFAFPPVDGGKPPIYIGTTSPVEARTAEDYEARVPEQERNFSEDFEKSALALCAEADRMPADGDRLRPTSEFQARRRAQVKAVCLAWSTLFPEQTALTTQRAKELLVAANDVAEDVYDALQSSAGKDYPFGYARKILANTPKPAAAGPASQSEDHTGEKMDWTPEMEAKTQAGIEKLRRMQGAKPRWFGEDA